MQHRHRLAITGHGHGAAQPLVVGAFDVLDAIEAEVIAGQRDRAAGLERNVALERVRLHEGNPQHEHAQPDVRDRHAEDRRRHADTAAQPVERVDQRGEDDPHASTATYRRQRQRVRIHAEHERQRQHQ